MHSCYCRYNQRHHRYIFADTGIQRSAFSNVSHICMAYQVVFSNRHVSSQGTSLEIPYQTLTFEVRAFSSLTFLLFWQEAFPKSKPTFSDPAFRMRLLDICAEWSLGVRPSFPLSGHWVLKFDKWVDLVSPTAVVHQAMWTTDITVVSNPENLCKCCIRNEPWCATQGFPV